MKILFTAILGLCALSAASSVDSDESPYLKPGERFLGKSLNDHVTTWWQWLFRMPDGVRATQDPTGRLCEAYQYGGLWYLAGTDGTGEASRQCTMPTEKHILVPLFVSLAHSTPEKPKTCDELKKSVRLNDQFVERVVVMIDGIEVASPLQFHQAEMDCFDPFYLAYYLKKKDSFLPAAADGYWLILKPLPVGNHILSVRFKYSPSKDPFETKEQQFRYELIVIDPTKSMKKEDSVAAI